VPGGALALLIDRSAVERFATVGRAWGRERCRPDGSEAASEPTARGLEALGTDRILRALSGIAGKGTGGGDLAAMLNGAR